MLVSSEHRKDINLHELWRWDGRKNECLMVLIVRLGLSATRSQPTKDKI
jgi:hypothetical protein